MELEELKELWDEFSEVPVDNDDRIEIDFWGFPAGTERFAVWAKFDDMCPNGVIHDLVKGGV